VSVSSYQISLHTSSENGVQAQSTGVGQLSESSHMVVEGAAGWPRMPLPSRQGLETQ